MNDITFKEAYDFICKRYDEDCCDGCPFINKDNECAYHRGIEFIINKVKAECM